MKTSFRCNAYVRSTGDKCKAKALANGKCRMHGGLSTGPKTPEGKANVAEATKQRMASGQMELAKIGYQRWLANGGRERLSLIMTRRHRHKDV